MRAMEALSIMIKMKIVIVRYFVGIFVTFTFRGMCMRGCVGTILLHTNTF